MTVEAEVANLTTAVNALTATVDVKKVALDDAVDAADAAVVSATEQVVLATTQVGIATTQAGIATTQATTATNQAAIAILQAAAAASSAALATAVVVSGDVALVPTAGQVPLARTDGRLNPGWIPKALEPVQAIENVSGTTGLPFGDDTQARYTTQMTERFTVFVPATLTTEMQLSRDGVFGAYLTTDKKLRFNFGGSYQTIESLAVSNDWVDFAFAYADNGTSAVTFDVSVDGAQFGSQQVVTYSDEYIRNIFEGEYGFLHLASMGYARLTNAGTTKTNLYGEACGLLPPVAGNAVNFTQATSTARPLIGRVPVGGLRNLLRYTNEQENAAWGKSDISVAVSAVLSPDGSSFFRKLVPNTSSTVHSVKLGLSVVSGVTYTYTVYATAAEYSQLSISRGAVGGFNPTGVYVFDLTTGTVIGTLSSGTATIEAIGGGVYRCRYTATAIATVAGNDYLAVFAASGGGLTFAGDDTSGVLIWGAQFEQSATATAYQRVGTTARDVTESGIANQDYLFFDRADDILTTTIDAITDGEIIIAGRNGIWRDSLTVSAGTFNIGSSGYTTNGGLLSLIGDVIGWAIKETAFTTPEADALYELFKERGAPGYFTIGAELVSDPSFNGDGSAWTYSGAWSVSGGEAIRTASTADVSMTQSLGVDNAVFYVYSMVVSARTAGTVKMGLGTSSYANGQRVLSAAGTSRGTSLPYGTNDTVSLIASNDFAGSISEVSVKAITFTPWS